MYRLDQQSWLSENDNSELITTQTERLKQLVLLYGCITINKFGKEAEHKAWLIVQHSNHDIKFQKHYLMLMKKSKDVQKSDIAYR